MSSGHAVVTALPIACRGKYTPSPLQARTVCATYSLQHWQLFLWNIARPFGQPLIVHCSDYGTVVTRFASSINFIRSDEVDGLDVDGSTSMASLRELIFFTCEDDGVVMASVKKRLEFSDLSEMKLCSDSPAVGSRDCHVSGATIACEASRTVWTRLGALDNCLELRAPYTLTWVPMSRPLGSIGPEIPILWSLFVDAQ
jgi:hypothetical protein